MTLACEDDTKCYDNGSNMVFIAGIVCASSLGACCFFVCCGVCVDKLDDAEDRKKVAKKRATTETYAGTGAGDNTNANIVERV